MPLTLKRALLAALMLVTGLASAEEPMLPEQGAAPATRAKPDSEPEIALDLDREIDLANIVTSAAKGVTTVQEAPAIITIITADEIKARGFKWLMEAVATVPGWLTGNALGNQEAIPLVRGLSQSFLVLRDGVSMFDPFGNIGWTGRSVPLESIKRIEVVTGPGGVLWGANSFMGNLNLISKDAEDVNGVELSSGYGDGSGNKADFKAYALFGKTFLNGKLKLFQHVSYETFIGETFDYPQLVASSPAPQPSGLAYFAQNAPRNPERSWWVIVDGKYTLGHLSLSYMVPFGDYHPNLAFASSVQTNGYWRNYTRHAVLEYKDRYAHERVGLTARAYAVQFVGDYSSQLFPASAFLPKSSPSDAGGLRLNFNDGLTWRVGGTVDADVVLPFHIRLLAGGEFFNEGIRNSTTTLPDPSDPNQLPIVCPVDDKGNRIPSCPRPWSQDTGRYVVAGYVDAQWRPIEKLTLDVGVRIQKGFGDLPYSLVPLESAAAVYNFLPGFHVKLSYATGFRAPVYNNTSTVPGGVEYGANPNLKTEASQSLQGEINARILHNVRNVRELELRADYSYTLLSDVIQVRAGSYGNTGARAIQSVEGYAKLHLKGDHFLQASYSYLYAVASDVGVIRAMPSQWFVVGGSFNLVKNLLDVNFNLVVLGAYQDPNRVPTGSAGSAGGSYFVGSTTASPSDLAFDRLTPVADLQLGFRIRFLRDRLQITGQFYNVLNQHYYYPDNFYDLTPTIELQPNPAPGFNFFARVNYRF